MKYFTWLFIAFVIILLALFPASICGDDNLSVDTLSISAQAGAQSGPPGPTPPLDEGWKCFATKRTVVYYQSEADLQRLNRKLKLGRSGGFLGLFAGKETGSITQRLERKLDHIFENAQDLLDMHNCKSEIKIMVYPEKDGVDRAYAGLVSKYKLSSVHSDHIAFYFHKLKTVYISVETATEGVLAHELAHCIIDHYFIIRPPSIVAETLARYVDKHLDRK